MSKSNAIYIIYAHWECLYMYCISSRSYFKINNCLNVDCNKNDANVESMEMVLMMMMMRVRKNNQTRSARSGNECLFLEFLLHYLYIFYMINDCSSFNFKFWFRKKCTITDYNILICYFFFLKKNRIIF